VLVTLSLNLPDDVVRQLTAHGEDLTRTALEALALEGYRSGKLTEAQVRRLLGYQTRMEVDGFLKQHGVYLEYTVEDLDREAAISRRLREQRQREVQAQDHEQHRAG
jgi:Uncharacterised protein family (UPF0175)